MNNAFKKILWALCLLVSLPSFGKVKIKLKSHIPQAEYAASRLQSMNDKSTIVISISNQGEAEGFTISRRGRRINIVGNDASGIIYGANRLLEFYETHHSFRKLTTITEVPEMKLRGACLGLQKTVYLPGHNVYEYPYTPENFPWFYDKDLWVKYLDLLASNNMNTVYLWNGHPFASLVKLDDYPFAAEVDDETMEKNQEMFSFLTTEAERRGIRVIQMFYNIILSKPFADHYGLKTQDRNRPITPLIADYTRKSIAAFVQKYPNVGFLVCLGEAMSGIDTDIQWMNETIIPGIKDGLKASGRTDTPPIILRSHDTDGPAVLKAALPHYPNIYTMSKYTGESLTTYEPGGPWGETHRQLAEAAPIHIDNVHILANLEPWRWSSPIFTQKAVQAMRNVHHSNGLHLYPQSSYWDWPYTADKLPNQQRLMQIDRDWMWYRAWGRYAWNCHRENDQSYWKQQLANYYGIDTIAANLILRAYEETGEIAPKLIRRFGITEGNRQTLLLGMKMAQLVNPYKFNIYPGFYESCGPKGEKLIEFVEKEWKGLPHEGELPIDIVTECVNHGRVANEQVQLFKSLFQPTKHQDELKRVFEDFNFYHDFAESFYYKVKAAQEVLNYKWSKDIKYLDMAVPLLEQSFDTWKQLAKETEDNYLYANSMQTAQRRIPVGGNDGHFKTWTDMCPVYEEELMALKEHIKKLHLQKSKGKNLTEEEEYLPLTPTEVVLPPTTKTTSLKKNAILFENRKDTRVIAVAPELRGLQAIVLNRDSTRIKGTTIEFSCDKPTQMLVGFFQDDDPKWAKAPKLETDATGNEYGQAEPVLYYAINMKEMPPIHIHAYHFEAGNHSINLPKGIICVVGFTDSEIRQRDVGLQSAGDEVDWLFLK